MANLADSIEAYLVALIEGQGAARVVVSRAAIARSFECAPSQVTYVLATRFSLERGFVVESRRGGGGYVRITRLTARGGMLRDILRATRAGLDQASSLDFIGWLTRERLVGYREALILRAAMDSATLELPWPERDLLRGRLLRSMLVALMTAEHASGPEPVRAEDS